MKCSRQGRLTKREPTAQIMSVPWGFDQFHLAGDPAQYSMPRIGVGFSCGELRAFDVALVLGKRPCYRISEQDIQAFEEKMQRTQPGPRNRDEKKASKNA